VSQLGNRDAEATWRYHDATKHSHLSVRSNPHFLDWSNQPVPFKIYPALELMPLPREAPAAGMAALSAIAENAGAHEAITPGIVTPGINEISQLLYFSAGITRWRRYPGGEIYFRAAACTGALYEIELYLACGPLPGVEPGLYHFSPLEFGLRRLRSGDYRRALAEATAGEPAIEHAELIMICTGTYWRNAWKYQARTYRHFGWDNGTLLANLLAMCAALRLPARLVLGFQDAEVNRLLDLDPQREVAFSMVAIGQVADSPPPSPAVEPLGLETAPRSQREVDYPVMREMHQASSLGSADEVRAWRERLAPADDRDTRRSAADQTRGRDGHPNARPRERKYESAGLEGARWGPRDAPETAGETPALQSSPRSLVEMIRLEPLSEAQLPRDPIQGVILRRGSARRFARQPITLAQLSTMLARATRGIPADFLNPPGAQLNHMYLIVNAVEGLNPGAYYFHRGHRELELLQEGDFRDRAAYLGLEQELPGDAAVDVFFLAQLEPILLRYGNRGYRAVQLEAGILGGKLYLAAYAQRLGATGLTFFDDDVTNFFSPHAQGMSAIFLTCLGRSAASS